MSEMKKYKISPISLYRSLLCRTLIQDYRRVLVMALTLTPLILALNCIPGHAAPKNKCTRLLEPKNSFSNLHSTITSGDLALTPLTSVHRKQLYQLFTTEDVNRFFLGFASPEKATPEHIQRARKSLRTSRRNFDGLWMIEHKGAIAGFIMLTKVELNRLSLEHEAHFTKENPDDLDLAVGYALDPKFRGHGIATLALQVATKFADETLGARYIFASANKLNEPSKEVLLRAGYEIFPHSSEKQNKFFKRLN